MTVTSVISAAFLLRLGGQDVSAANLKKVLASIGAADDEICEKVGSACEGKDVLEIAAEGQKDLVSAAAPSAGAAAPAAGGVPPPAAPIPDEEDEESEGDIGLGLFD